MELQIWWIWMILAVILIVGEIFTAGFFIIWFGIGAAAAGVCAMFGFGTGWQWSVFIIVSGILLAVSRKFADRFTKEQPPGIGANRLMSKTATVIQEINNSENSGRVRLEKEEWRAESENDEVIPKNQKVKIIRVEGTHLIVKSLTEGD